MAIIKNYLSLKERVMFVNNVRQMCEMNGTYSPALYDYAFRVNIALFFTDMIKDEMSADEITDVAYNDEITKMIIGSHKNILTGLAKACREEIEHDYETKKMEKEYALKNQPWEDMISVFEDLAAQLDVKEMVKTIAQENMKKPVDNVTTVSYKESDE